MTFGVQLQGLFRYDDEDFDFSGRSTTVEDTDIDPLSDFEMRRARISLSGGAFAPWFKYKLEVDFGLGRTRATDLYVDMDFSDTNRWRVGQFKKPYDLFDLYSSKTLMSSSARRKSLHHAGNVTSRDVPRQHEGQALQLGRMIGNGNGRTRWATTGTSCWARASSSRTRAGSSISPPRSSTREARVHRRRRVPEEPEERARGRRRDRGDGADREVGSDYPCVIGTARAAPGQPLARQPAVLRALRGKIFQVNATYQFETDEDAAADEDGDPADIELDAYAIEAGFFVTPVEIADATTS